VVPVLLSSATFPAETNRRQWYTIDVPSNFLVSDGINTIRLHYNTNTLRYRNALLAIYDISFRSQ
ncbi:MAG: hypothetical protein FWC98_05755, partial [Bacteroidales bacterium]|nr:hypothetical protein [Bacteroidales bacterium]